MKCFFFQRLHYKLPPGLVFQVIGRFPRCEIRMSINTSADVLLRYAKTNYTYGSQTKKNKRNARQLVRETHSTIQHDCQPPKYRYDHASINSFTADRLQRGGGTISTWRRVLEIVNLPTASDTGAVL